MNENNEVYYDKGIDLILPIVFGYANNISWGSTKETTYYNVEFVNSIGSFKKGDSYAILNLSRYSNGDWRIFVTNRAKTNTKEYRLFSTDLETAYIRESNKSIAAKPLLEDYKSPELSATLGLKESESKLEYELDFEFIKSLAERMTTNKGKYPPYNWKKPMDVDKLKQALFRHTVEVMSGKYTDDDRDYGHLEAIACNIMMIMYQLKNHKQ